MVWARVEVLCVFTQKYGGSELQVLYMGKSMIMTELPGFVYMGV